jgi:hypothetical protein
MRMCPFEGGRSARKPRVLRLGGVGQAAMILGLPAADADFRVDRAQRHLAGRVVGRGRSE